MAIALEQCRATGGQAAAGEAVRVRGLVQGVGFRPHAWRLAAEFGLAGEVWNDAEGVLIRIWGPALARRRFLARLCAEAPPLARIDALETEALDEAPPAGFQILASHAGVVRTGVVPDAATCPACLAEIRDRKVRRHRYVFTNCTHCGPRLSIVRGIPYDRARTSMAPFEMCPACRAEYDDPGDRRFHAQPNACPACGPKLWVEGPGLAAAEPVAATRALLEAGAIVAIKGIGGFHLAVDATNMEAVQRLRARKRRYDKPFALIARDLDVVRRYCALGADEQALLRSPAAPIVILDASGPQRVAPAVAPGQRTLGFMLPYTPLHHLLLADLERPIVLTSGNRSEEPQVTDNDDARVRLAGIADALLMHDRAIVNRLDDSVVRIMAGAPRPLRRARGYAPAPLPLPAGFAPAPPLLAMGGELKTTFCLVQDGQATLSQHIGDLEEAATFADYRLNLALYRELLRHEPELVALDRHPDYLSTKLGRELAAAAGLEVTGVQHHHAHIAACLADNGVPLGGGPVLGVALDGLGYGEDGTIWGGEFLRADYGGFTRLGHFRPVPMLGGAQAIREPWRSTYAHLVQALGWERCLREHGRLELCAWLRQRPLATLDAMLGKGLNCPRTSSCGRLFDAVAAALGICRERASYEGQAAIELEALVDDAALDAAGGGYPFRIERAVLDAGPMWQALLADLGRGALLPVMAARFHLGLADAVVGLVSALSSGPDEPVALSGGVFQNRILFERVSEELRARGLTVLGHRRVPANDGGLALGQAAVAAARALHPGTDREVAACV